MFEVGINTLIHPTAEIERTVSIGDNCKIGKGTVIRRNVEIRDNVEIGENCYIDSGVIITGNAKIGDNVTLRNLVVVARGSVIGNGSFLAPRVMFNNLDEAQNSVGGAIVGENCFIGTNTVLQHGIIITDEVKIGSMSLVTKDISEKGIYFGCPAKKQS